MRPKGRKSSLKSISFVSSDRFVTRIVAPSSNNQLDRRVTRKKGKKERKRRSKRKKNEKKKKERRYPEKRHDESQGHLNLQHLSSLPQFRQKSQWDHSVILTSFFFLVVPGTTYLPGVGPELEAGVELVSSGR